MKFFNFIRNSISAFFYFIGFFVFGLLLASPKMPNYDEAGNVIEGTHNTVSFVLIISVFVFTPILIGFLIGYKKSLHLLILISLTVLSIIFFASPEFYEIFGQYLNQIITSFSIITLLLIGFQFYQTYNNLVKLDEGIKKNWSDIEIAYKKRVDTITELTENSDKYLDHEKSTLTDVIAARKILSGSDLNYTNHKVELLDNLEKSFGNIMATIEAYPELKGKIPL